jgi:hypothetical protein
MQALGDKQQADWKESFQSGEGGSKEGNASTQINRLKRNDLENKISQRLRWKFFTTCWQERRVIVTPSLSSDVAKRRGFFCVSAWMWE